MPRFAIPATAIVMAITFNTASINVFGADPSRPPQRIGDSFRAGYSLEGAPHSISSTPWIILRPTVNPGSKQCAVSVSTGVNGFKVVSRFSHLKEGTLVPLHGKIFAVTQFSEGTDGRSVVLFEVRRDSEFLKSISANGDTYFLPYSGSGRINDVELTIHPAPKDGLGKSGQVVIFAKPVGMNQKVGENGDWVNVPQVVGDGDLIRFGSSGVRVRKVVVSDDAKNTRGWIEVIGRVEEIGLQ